MGDLRDVNLFVFLTRGASLRSWDRKGLLDREVALYRALAPHLGKTALVTYGGREDLAYQDRLGNTRIICNRLMLPRPWYVAALCNIQPLFWRGSGVFKSNQVLGADVALRAARRSGKRFLARCGYLPSNIAAWRYGRDSGKANKARRLEAEVFGNADCVAVTTPAMRETVIERYGLDEKKVHVIPNYVDTDRFRAAPLGANGRRLCYVGRLEREKNVEALVDATQGMDVELILIGRGPLEAALKEKARRRGLPVRFLGYVPNDEIPTHLNQSRAFIMPSHIEHHPKALLEAMACGLPVIGADVPGIRELIDHEETGYLSATSPEDLRMAIQSVLDDDDLGGRMGLNAREFVVGHFALTRVLEMELALLEKVAFG